MSSAVAGRRATLPVVPPREEPQAEMARRSRLSRRGLLGGALAVGAGVAGARLLESGSERPAPPPVMTRTIPFHGPHQAGILTPSQRRLELAAFDVRATTRDELQLLLRDWTTLAAQLTGGHVQKETAADGAPADTGERDGLGPAGLTVTFGLGPGLFTGKRGERFGLSRRRPAALAPLPAFRGDSVEPARSDGDLLVQICADDAQVSFHALHALTRAGHGAATLRWAQSGFLPDTGAGQTPRNLMGFKDGTNNPEVTDAELMHRHVWADRADGSDWMHGGSYLVVRRIRMLLDVWDATTLAGQERTIGRHKGSGAPLGAHKEHDTPALADPASPIASDAHIRLASADANDGARLLRRAYSYHDGFDPDTAQLDAGLVFLAYQRDPRRQFVPIQRRLAQHDALSRHTLHTASGLFACPPGTARGGYVGASLFDPRA